MATFAVRMVHGPAWDSRREIREQPDWDSHAAFMDALVDEGVLLIGGPVGYDAGALHLVEAVDEQDVRARLGADPWARSGVLRIGAVDPWLIWLDGRAKAPAVRHPHSVVDDRRPPETGVCRTVQTAS